MSVVEQPQPMQALQAACRLKTIRAAQRDALIGSTPRRLVPALITPTPELGTYSLRKLFASSEGRYSLIRRLGLHTLQRVLRQLEEEKPLGRRWTPDVKLADLTESERRRLARALVAAAPRVWRES